MNWGLYLRAMNWLDGAGAEMRSMGVCQEGIDIMVPKMRHFVFKVKDLDPRAANILKQEMLAVDGEAAISYHAISDLSKPTDCLISGTGRQFQIVLGKLRAQPFGLKELAGKLAVAFENVENTERGRARTRIMGILNVTPDSFSDGGRFLDPEKAAAHGLAMAREGADIIDVGGESTRPGAEPVTTEEVLDRVIPVILKLAGKLEVPISIDSRNPTVVRKAVEAGAGMVNLVGGFRDDEMAEIVAEADVPVILMHMQGAPGDMQADPRYDNVMDDIVEELWGQMQTAARAGIKPENIILDPGLGFGKTMEHNLAIIHRLGELRILGCKIMAGASRKSFIGRILDADEEERLEGSLASAVLAAANGADMVRVHDVGETVRAIRLSDAICDKS